MNAPSRDEHEHLVSGAKIVAVLLAGAAFCGVNRPTTPALQPLPEAVQPSLIPNYHRMSPDLATGGAPTEGGLRRLGDLGFQVIVDLRSPAEGTAAERTAVEASGLRYVGVPITPETFSIEQVKAVGTLLDEPGRGPVLLHCGSGNRVGAVWTVLQVLKGRVYAEAEAEGREIGLQSPAMIDAVRRVVGEGNP